MAKSYGNLWPRLVSWENLCLAYRRCRRRKRYKRGAVAFEFAWEANLLELQRELLGRTIRDDFLMRLIGQIVASGEERAA